MKNHPNSLKPSVELSLIIRLAMKISKLFKGIQTIQSKKRISLQQSSNPAIHQSAPGMILSRHDSVYFAFKFVSIREIRVNSLIHLRVNSTKFDQI